jgi:hypothetical protein
MKCRDTVYKRQFHRFSGACCFTNTHGMLVVVKQNMCGVPAVHTCMDLIQSYLYHPRTLAHVESIKVVACRDRVYTREFERFSGAYCSTNTHGMVVVVRQNMRGVPAWT